ncbi:MAG: hypothetical protein GF401_13880 [Chitinivibrionales bacterium]|nr:hypothetical protein [Chitinivibrionales bacterium]
MGHYQKFFLFIVWVSLLFAVFGENSHYITNKPPLEQTAYAHLPLGTVKPKGWLYDQLRIQADGLSGYAYSSFNAGRWSITNYHEGIIALAFVLDDARLKDLAKDHVDEILTWSVPSINIRNNYHYQHAVRGLIEYYEATGYQPAFDWLQEYFELNKDEIASAAFGYCCNSGSRIGENLIALYWLYNRTGDTALINATGPQYKDNIDTLADGFSGFPQAHPTDHSVDIAQEIKFPGLYYQQYPLDKYKNAVFTGLENIDTFFGQVGGRFSGHELLPTLERGLEPTNGTELCAVMEFAYSMERLFEIFGDITLADRLESIVYNSIPGAFTPDMWAHQYDQQANQVLVDRSKRVFDNSETANCYGLTPHYPCCLSNMHQGWPRFVENMWMATHDNGVIAVAYGPSEVTARVGAAGTEVVISEETEYPFKGSIAFTVALPASGPVEFPLHFRIPSWAGEAFYVLDGDTTPVAAATIAVVNRTWSNGDSIYLHFPMKIRSETRFRNAVGILRGPLYFSLRIGQDHRSYAGPRGIYPSYDWEIFPTTAWNYGLCINSSDVNSQIQTSIHSVGEFPFAGSGESLFVKTAEDPDPAWEKRASTTPEPVVLTAKARIVDNWGAMFENSAENPPLSPVYSDNPTVEVELVPYGCARLRISEFPVVDTEMVVYAFENINDAPDPEFSSGIRINGTILFPGIDKREIATIKIYTLSGALIACGGSSVLEPGTTKLTASPHIIQVKTTRGIITKRFITVR